MTDAEFPELEDLKDLPELHARLRQYLQGHWSPDQVEAKSGALDLMWMGVSGDAGNVQQWIKNECLEMERHLLHVVKGCESPIEMLFVLEFDSLSRFLVGYSLWEFSPQFTVECRDGRKFRVDFLCTVGMDPRGDQPGFEASVIVECDGHDFHEKTKQQAAQDKKRQRALEAEGYHVLRFTGSEIHKSPQRCAFETFKFLMLHGARSTFPR